MAITEAKVKNQYQISPGQILSWRVLQLAVWFLGVFILFCLFCFQKTGLLLFWNILIPVAPALLVLAPGLWRNICPLATTVLMPRYFNLSKRKKLSQKQTGILNLIGVSLLFIIVPLRHPLFNNSGIATGLLITTMALTGVFAGFFYERKSFWCSGVCPVHPVEKLYGENVFISVPNVHCEKCVKCVIACPDSILNITPERSAKTVYQKISALLITGALPGFIWGWFQVPDETKTFNLSVFAAAYKMPLTGAAFTLLVYAAFSAVEKRQYEKKLISIFAACSVACYYWFRVPALFGFGGFNTGGLLINLRGLIPGWIFVLIPWAISVFFFYWLVLRKPNKKSWLFKPQYAPSAKTNYHN